MFLFYVLLNLLVYSIDRINTSKRKYFIKGGRMTVIKNRLTCRYIMGIFFIVFGFNVEATTPFDNALAENRITRIECEYNDVTYHYDVYLPNDYHTSKKPHPVIFIFSPGGYARMNNMENWIREHNWIAVMLVESRNGPWDPIIGNFLAAHDDVLERLSIDSKRKILTGFSGGARAASLMALEKIRPDLDKVFLQAAGFYAYSFEYPNKPYIYGSFGKDDPNHGEIDYIKYYYDSTGEFFKYESYIGTHQWAPQAVAERALDWLVTKVPEVPVVVPPSENDDSFNSIVPIINYLLE